jgi:hypothetical protein
MVTGKVIYGLLDAATAVKAIIGNKVYPMVAPQSTVVPFVTYRTINRTPSHTKDGPSHLDTYNFEVNMYHNNYTTLVDLCEKIRQAIDSYSGTVNGQVVQHITYDNGSEGYIEDGNYFYIQETYSMRIPR